MLVVASTKLRDLREELGLSQERLAALSGVSRITVSNAENGRKVIYNTGMGILRALNAERRKRGMKSLKLEDLELGRGQ